MGRFEKQHVPYNDNDVSDPVDYDEVVVNAVQDVNHGLDAIEQIEAMLQEGFEIYINFEDAGDMEQEVKFHIMEWDGSPSDGENSEDEDYFMFHALHNMRKRPKNEGIVMSFPYEDNTDDGKDRIQVRTDLYPEDNESLRQIQLKSGLIADGYQQQNYAWAFEDADFNDYDDSPDNLRSLSPVDQVFRSLASFPLTSDLYDSDPLVQEEIAYEIVELGQLIRSEFFGEDFENNPTEMGEEDSTDYWNELEE